MRRVLPANRSPSYEKPTQFEGTLEVFKELDGEFHRDARHFVQFELADRFRDEAFLAEVALLNGGDETRHHELTVLRCFASARARVRLKTLAMRP
jgi:hypothetical protein